MRATRKAIEGSYWPDGQPLVRRSLAPDPERMDPPQRLRWRGPLPPQTQRFPTDEELDRLWGKV